MPNNPLLNLNRTQVYETLISRINRKDASNNKWYVMRFALLVLAQVLSIVPNYCYGIVKTDEEVASCDKKPWSWFSSITFMILMLSGPCFFAYGLFKRKIKGTILNGFEIEHTESSRQVLDKESLNPIFKIMPAVMIVNYLISYFYGSFLSFSLNIYISVYSASILLVLSMLNGLP